MYNNNVCIWYIKCIVYIIWKIVFIIKSSQKYVVTHDIIDIFWCLKYVPWCLCLISNEYIRWTGWRMSWWVSRRSTRPSPRSSSRPSQRCLDTKDTDRPLPCWNLKATHTNMPGGFDWSYCVQQFQFIKLVNLWK